MQGVFKSNLLTFFAKCMLFIDNLWLEIGLETQKLF